MSPLQIPDGGPDKLVGLDFDCDCGKHHKVEVKKVVVGSGAIRYIRNVLRELDLTGRFALVYDKNIRPLASKYLFGTLDYPGISYDAICFEKEGEVKASVESSDEMRAMLPANIEFLMVMGSGTMNDLTKWAATVLGIPYVVVATAPSMNGYTSSISALSKDGFKTTQDILPAAAVIADVDILKATPVEMIRAGMGDLLSKNVCNADWRLSHRIKGTYFCEVPQQLIRMQEEYYLAHAEDLGNRDPQAVHMLTEAIMGSGFSMAIVGESSPSSGAEHLISHYWEMQDEMAGRELQLHGAQVGVGSIIAAELYEKLQKLDPDDIDVEAARENHMSLEQLREQVDRHYGEVADQTFEETTLKATTWEEKRKELENLKTNWADIIADVSRFLRTRAELESAMSAAGGPLRPADLGISPEQTFDAIMNARLMRNRYTILDVAHDIGKLHDWATEVTQDLA